jgi:hypothetical protein
MAEIGRVNENAKFAKVWDFNLTKYGQNMDNVRFPKGKRFVCSNRSMGFEGQFCA